MIKIAEVRAFAIHSEMVGAKYSAAHSERDNARRAAWTRDAEVAGPLSGYPRFKRHRSSWRLDGAVGCLVTASDGTTGFGVTRHGQAVIALINDHLAGLLVGEKAMATEQAWDIMMRAGMPYGPGGLSAYAISAVDLALWDLKGKLLKTPVYALAGGNADEPKPCYATGNDTDWHMELGFKATKLACPYGPNDGMSGLTRVEELVGRTRELIGPDIDLMLDCWLALDVEFAVRLAERLRPYHLRWIEDALVPDNLDAHVALRERLNWMAIATGEHWYTPEQFMVAASRRLADVLQPDICWAGGLTGCLRIATIADAAGIEVIPHAGMNTPYGQHFSFARPTVRAGEYFVGSAPGVPLSEALVFPGMAVPVEGGIKPNDAPGFGLGLTSSGLDELARV